MVNVYDHHNCESTWHQPCIQIYCTKKEPYNHLFQTTFPTLWHMMVLTV